MSGIRGYPTEKDLEKWWGDCQQVEPDALAEMQELVKDAAMSDLTKPLKRYLVTYKILSTRRALVEAESEEEAYDIAASGSELDTEIASEYAEDVSCEDATRPLDMKPA